MASPGQIPNFIYIGAAKCASTWIFRSLQAHPQVYVPPAKDIFFFDREYQRGIGWYQSFFEPAKAHHIRVGELSHFYLYSQEAAQRIRENLPWVKLLACVRNPIRRAWSAYLFKKRNGLVSCDLETALADDPRMIEHGLYSSYVSYYTELFGDAQFKVLVYDDLEADPVEFGRCLYELLGVDPEFQNPFANQKVLPASEPRSAPVAALTRRAARLVRRLGLANLVGRIKSSNVVTGMLYVPLENGRQERISSEQWERLAEPFTDDINRLSQLLGRDLTHWLQRPGG